MDARKECEPCEHASPLAPGDPPGAIPRPGMPHAPGEQQPAPLRERRSVAGNHPQEPATCGGPPALVRRPAHPAYVALSVVRVLNRRKLAAISWAMSAIGVPGMMVFSSSAENSTGSPSPS